MTELTARLQKLLDLPETIGIPRKEDGVIGLLPETVQEIIAGITTLRGELERK